MYFYIECLSVYHITFVSAGIANEASPHVRSFTLSHSGDPSINQSVISITLLNPCLACTRRHSQTLNMTY